MSSKRTDKKLCNGIKSWYENALKNRFEDWLGIFWLNWYLGSELILDSEEAVPVFLKKIR